MKLKVVYIPYARYEECNPEIGHITATSFREAVIKMLSNVRMYTTEDDILDREAELGRELTEVELINILALENGDGCDFIVLLMDETTGEKYFECDPGFTEWEI